MEPNDPNRAHTLVAQGLKKSYKRRTVVRGVDIHVDKGEVVVSGCVADKVTFSQPFEFRTGLKAAPEAWHSLTVRHAGTDMVVTLDGRTARKKVDLPAVFMNTAILGGAPHTGNPFFTGRVRKLVIDHACN